MNTFLAREVAMWLLLSCIVVVVPLLLILQPLINKTLRGLPDIKSRLENITAGISEKYSKQKQLRKALKQAKQEREIAEQKKIDEQAEAQRLQALKEEEILLPVQNDLPGDSEVALTEESEQEVEEQNQEIMFEEDDRDSITTKRLENTDELIQETETQEDSTLVDETLSFENEVAISGSGSTRTLIHSNDIDQQKFQKQIESIKYAALTYKERGKDDKYEKKLIEGLSMDQDNEEFMGMLADHYFTTGNFVKALTLLKKIITVQTDNHKAIWQIGRIYQSQQKIDAAQLLVEKALERKPDHPKYLISLVEIYYDKDEKRNALDVMQRLRKIRPTNIDYLLTVATLHEELNEPTFARNYYMKILELSPNNEHAKEGIKKL